MTTLVLKRGAVPRLGLRASRATTLLLPETAVCSGGGKANPFGPMGGLLVLFDGRAATTVRVERVELLCAAHPGPRAKSAVALAQRKRAPLCWLARVRAA